MTLELPCYVGDRVFAYLDDAPPKKKPKYNRNSSYKPVKRGLEHLTECVIFEISIVKYAPEPVFIAINYEKAEFKHFSLSDFGKEIFTREQYWAEVLKENKEIPLDK